jgi:hypothetical protein
VACGSAAWLKGSTTIVSDEPHLVAASDAWTDEDAYSIRLCFYETPFCPTITCRFSADCLTYDVKERVRSGRPSIHGC